jgi:hypothetical protein
MLKNIRKNKGIQHKVIFIILLKLWWLSNINSLGAQDWNRTSTFLRTADFESAASTNSATWAMYFLWQGQQYYNF